jgi:2-amino-4-hydroxy-6-hydroxymethyldihydropteridine diphosphokinase
VTRAFVGLGGNVGEPTRHLEQAFDALDRLPRTKLVRRSSLFRSAPLGYADQPEFVNAVAELETELPAPQLLAELHAIENEHGRSRSFPNAPRTLDLDLLLFGSALIDAPGLTVPHPRMHERAFVLEPLVEIAPLTMIPGRGPAMDLLLRCKGQVVERIG